MRWIRVVGVVVAVDEFHGRRVFTIDDSSGACIETITNYTPPPKPERLASAVTEAPNGNLKSAKASKAKDAAAATKQDNEIKIPLPYEQLDVGHVVDVKGRLTSFRDEMQIEIVKMTTLRSTEQEITLWERRTKFRQEILDKPWILTERQIRRCQTETDPEEDKAARKKRRLRAAAEGASSRAHGKHKTRANQEKKAINGDNVVD